MARESVTRRCLLRACWVSWVAPVLGGISLPALPPVSVVSGHLFWQLSRVVCAPRAELSGDSSTRPFRTSALHQFRLSVLRERITNELSKCLPN